MAVDDIKFKRGSAARWMELNLVLLDGEPGYERDTGKVKIGDGIHRWADLPYSLGKSAYDVALDNGFVGTQEEWLASLNGAEVEPPINLTILFENALA